jgi:hypothetical protein
MRGFTETWCGGRPPRGGVGRVVRALAKAWMRGWTAFATARGDPYLSQVARRPPRRDGTEEQVWTGADGGARGGAFEASRRSA